VTVWIVKKTGNKELRAIAVLIVKFIVVRDNLNVIRTYAAGRKKIEIESMHVDCKNLIAQWNKNTYLLIFVDLSVKVRK
jgi:hypothetical protein